MIDIDKQLLTAEQYANLTPFEKGFASYWQGARNPAVPDSCPFTKGSHEAAQWISGQRQAVVAAMDVED